MCLYCFIPSPDRSRTGSGSLRRSSCPLPLALSDSLTSVHALRLTITGMSEGALPVPRPWSENRVRLLASTWPSVSGRSSAERGKVLSVIRQEWHLDGCESRGSTLHPSQIGGQTVSEYSERIWAVSTPLNFPIHSGMYPLNCSEKLWTVLLRWSFERRWNAFATFLQKAQ